MKLKISKIAVSLIVLITAAVFTACNKKENPKPVPPVISQDSARAIDKQMLADKVKKILGDSLKIIEPGKYQIDSSSFGVVAGTEISNPKMWGIRFTYFKDQNNNLVKAFETPLLKGSFKEAMVRRIKLANSSYEMIYYDSQDYFLGSGGGEIFSYIVDLDNDKVYSAHFFTVPRRPVSLYLSSNIDNPEIREIFVKHFQKDYPELKLINKDYNLEDIF